jgi:hypothetical protein
MAMSSCVPSEQNELVVRTGTELRLHKLGQIDVKMTPKNHFFVTGGTHVDRICCYHFLREALGIPISNCSEHLDMSYQYDKDSNYWYSSKSKYPKITLKETFMHYPKEYRSNSIVICFSEHSYNGRQSLYHNFGSKYGIRSYDLFVEIMEQLQKDGDAIVFGMDKLLWFPSANYQLYNDKGELVDPSTAEGIRLTYEYKKELEEKAKASFKESIKSIRESSTKCQLIEISNTLKQLTEAVNKLIAAN